MQLAHNQANLDTQATQTAQTMEGAVFGLAATNPFAAKKEPSLQDKVMEAMRDGIDFLMECLIVNHNPRISEIRERLAARHSQDVVAKAIVQLSRMGRLVC